MKNIVTFVADFPDDSVWTDQGELCSPRGQAVADALSAALSQRSLICSPPSQYSFYGWVFYVDAGCRFRCIVQYTEPWLLICELVPTIGDRLFRRRHENELEVVLSSMRAILEFDPRFSSANWFSQQEYDAIPS